jgi:hydrogenase expression/formation protein HypC
LIITMCIAIPGKVKKIKENNAFFDYLELEYKADISLAPEVKVGDWILMHDGRALSKITEKEAKENLEFIKTHDEMARE